VRKASGYCKEKQIPRPQTANKGWRSLFGAVGDPEKVVELLGVAGVGVVGAFVLVLDVGAGGLGGFSGFTGGVAGAAVDGASGGLWKSGGCEG
jgi:hypothetical protein